LACSIEFTKLRKTVIAAGDGGTNPGDNARAAALSPTITDFVVSYENLFVDYFNKYTKETIER
jgi:hypothetical protein